MRVFRLIQILLFAAISVLGCKDKRVVSVNAVRELRAALRCYAMIHNGALPPDLPALIKDAKKQGSTYEGFNEWNAFYFVGGLSTNDPPNMPVAISDPATAGIQGMVLLLNGEIVFFKDISSEAMRSTINEPWGRVRSNFKDVREFETFKQRLTIWPPASVGPRAARGQSPK